MTRYEQMNKIVKLYDLYVLQCEGLHLKPETIVWHNINTGPYRIYAEGIYEIHCARALTNDDYEFVIGRLENAMGALLFHGWPNDFAYEE